MYTNISNRNYDRPQRPVSGLGAVHYAPRLPTGGVSTLMHVGHDGLGGVGPDFSATAKTIGWLGLAVFAYSKFVSKDEGLAKKALPIAAGGFAAGFVL